MADYYQALLLLGSNIDPEINLPLAVHKLGRYGRVRRISGVWESPAMGNPGAPGFLNAALLLETSLSAGELKEAAIARVEAELGRVRCDDRNAPRTMDIDIILFGHSGLLIGSLSFPDPDLLKRPFVAIPVAEIAPKHIHPETGETFEEISARFNKETWRMRRRPDVLLESEEIAIG